MTTLQIEGIVRQLLTMFGAYFVGAGYLDNDTLVQIVGAAAVLISTGWTIARNRKTGVIGAAAALPEVTAISVTSRSFAAKVPSDKVNASGN